MRLTTRYKSFPITPDKHLVANAISGELSVMTNAGVAALEAVRRGQADRCPDWVLRALERRQLTFPESAAEEEAFTQLCRASWAAFQRESPRHYTFVVNAHCNFRCPYCFEEAYAAPKATLTVDQIDAAFRVIDRYADRAGVAASRDVEVFGGEPLLPGSRRMIGHLLRRVQERQSRASIQTNGYHLASYVELFREHAEHIGQVQVTLDGPREVHDQRRILRGGRPTFDRIVAAIDALARENLPIPINVRMNVDRENIDQLAAMAQVYEERGWTRDDRFTFVSAPVDDRCGTLRGRIGLVSWPELLERVLPLSRDSGRGPFDLSVFKLIGYFRHCFDVALNSSGASPLFVPKVVYCEAAALKLFAFHPDGCIYPCPEAVGMTSLAIGRYAPELRLDRRRARAWRSQTILGRARCRQCKISTFCGGGCVLGALKQNGTMADPVCDDAEEQLECYVAHVSQRS